MKFSENIEHVRCLAHLFVRVVVCIEERIAFGVTNSCRHLILAILQSLILLAGSTSGVEAQVDNWGGTVMVSEHSVPIEPGQSNTYSVRLSKPPTEAGVVWFVMVHINGVRYTGGVYKDLSLVPGFYRRFDTGDWNTWKNFRITRAGDDYTGERAGRVTLTHEVWDHNSNCPVHGVGSVTVTGGNNGGRNNGGGNNGGGNNGGGNNGGGNNGGGNNGGGNNGGGNNGGGNNGGGNNGGGNNGGGNNGGGDNDEPPPVLPPPAVSVADASAVEGDKLGFVVRLSRPSDEPVTVRYGTASGTAEEGVDYEATSGVLSFGPAIVQRTVEVQSREDELDERDETFTVGLSEPVGALLGNAVGVGTIIDDNGQQSVKRVSLDVLPEMGRALAFSAARCRIEQMFSDIARGWSKPSTAGLLPPAFAGRGTQRARTLGLKQAFDNASYLIPLGVGGDARFAAWACGDYRRLDGGDKAGTALWDGDVFNMQIGAETRLRPNMLAGVALARAESEIDYTIAGENREAGTYDLQMTGVHPYFGLKPSSDLEIWGTAGFGSGTLRVSNSAGANYSGDARLASGSFGVNSRMLERGSTTLTAKGEFGLANLDVSSASRTFAKAAVDLQRFRLAAEIDHEKTVPYVGTLAPWGEVGLRHDSGDGKAGASLELGGGLHYRNVEQGWNSEVFGRWLAVREDGRPKEHGFGFRFRYDPEAPGFGPWASLAQGWAPTASGVQRLWEDRRVDSSRSNLSARRLELELAYGFRAFRGRGALTPYTRLSLNPGNVRSYRLGTRVNIGPSAILSLEAARQERSGADDINAIILQAAARF